MTHRNGYRPRGWETRVGEIELLIPRKRQGPAYFPSFLEPRRRSEQAIVAVVLEAYVNGVSHAEGRPPRGAARDRGDDQGPRLSACAGRWMSRSRCSASARFEGAYPYLWLDAKHVKVRSGGHVRSKALVDRLCGARDRRARGDRPRHRRGRVGRFWIEFLRSLRARGLTGVRLAISDHHEGLKHAIAQVLACPWQRCTVHFVQQHARPLPPPPARPRLRRARARCSTPRTTTRHANASVT